MAESNPYVATSAIELPSSGRRQADSTAFLLDAARISVPDARAESVSRIALVNRLRAAREEVVTLVAPAGYGKTTVLVQWAARDRRPFAWLSIAEDDGRDALSLARAVAAALVRVGLVDGASLDTLGSRRKSATAAIRSLVSALSSPAKPFVLVLDDVHRLRSRECADVVAALAERVPAGSTLTLAGRFLPRFPSARLRMAGRLLELGTDQLALSRREIDALVRRLAGEVDASKLAGVAERTEGWAAGVYLAVLPLQEASSGASPNGPEQSLADYFDFEHLSGLSAGDVRFLTRTSLLDAMSGPLCDAVLETEGSARKLASFSRSSLFMVPVDRPGEWFRYHHLFRSFLRSELERREPELVAALNRRAAAWCQANGAPEAAICYAHASGDVDLLARLVVPRLLPALAAGNVATVETWLGWFDDESGLERYPALAVLGAWVHALRGRPAEAERWLDVASRSPLDEAPPDGSASLRPWLALVRAAMCTAGGEQMRADAELALRELGPASRWRATALFLRGAAHLLLGERDRAEANMADAAEAAASVRSTPIQVAALAEWSLLVAGRGDEERAEALALQARGLVDEHGLGDYVSSVIACAVSARRGLHTGDLDLARAELDRARALRPRLTHALPWLSAHASLELAHVELSLLDVPGARSWLSHGQEIVRRRPDLGVLPGRLGELDAEIAEVAKEQEKKASTLTAAEVRLLPFLATHLSFREIGEHLYVSRNTVKTQAISVYRKLGVSSRSKAIERAVDLGLIDGGTAVNVDFTRRG